MFTFSVCGSMKTLEFLRWLGIDVPRWIENDLRHSTNPLAASLEQAQATAVELMDFCRRLGVPSASTWKVSPSVVRRSKPPWTSQPD